MNMYIFIYMCVFIRRPLPERERASSHCHQPRPCNSADSNQPLLQYLAIYHPADCNLPTVYCRVQLTDCSILKGVGQICHRGQQAATGCHRLPQAGQPSGPRWPQIHLKSMRTNESQ